MQVLRVTASPGTTGYYSDQLGGKLCSVAYRETSGSAGATITLRGDGGDSVDIIAANGVGLVHGISLKQVVVSGNGSTVVVDARTEPETIDPSYLNASGTVENVAITSQSAGLALNSTALNVWSNFPSGKVPIAMNGGILIGSS